MENRFLRGDRSFMQSRPGLRPPGSENPGLFALDSGVRSYQSSSWAQPFSASNRTLVILIENGGVDLGIPALVDRLLAQIPGADAVPDGLRRKLVDYLRQKIIGFTDNLLETAELSLNRYAASKPEFFGDVVVLRDGTASYQDLKGQLFALSRAGKIIDLLILTHGGEDFISVTGGISSRRIRDLRAEFGKPLSLRSVYMMNCVGSSLNQAWLDAGAKVSSGAVRNNYLPEPTTYFFWKAWKAGQGFEGAASSAYQKTIDLMDETVRGFLSELPAPLNMLANFVNFAGMDFVKDSAPVIQGQGSVSISSDDLIFSQSMARSSVLATTVLPLSVLRSLATAKSAVEVQHPPGAISQQSIDFIKAWEGFRATVYNDHGQCAIGYGTALHVGNCDGQVSEQPYVNGVTEEKATQMLAAKAGEVQQVINDAIHVNLNQNQNDALLSFIYNLGGENFRRSTLLRLLNQGNYAAVPLELRKWSKARHDGKLVDLPGLVKRRAAEAELFQKPVLASGQSLPMRIPGRAMFSAAQGTDIPLDPGAGGRSVDENALQTGDIIVSTTGAQVSSLIRWATKSQVSHAVLYIGGGQVVEAVGEGVMLRSLADAVAEATVAVAFRHPSLTTAQALVVRDFAGQQLGKAYNYWGIVRQGGFQLDRETFCSGKGGADYDRCVNWVGRVNLGKGDDDSFFCSQLVVAAYQNAGVPLTSTPPNWNSPDNLAQLGMSKRLGYVGHLKAPAANAQSLGASLSLVSAPLSGRTTLMQTLASPLGFSAVEWEPLISFRPPVAIQRSVKSKGIGWHIHRLEDAYGDINLDYYPVSITAMPVVGGRTLSAAEFLSHIRLNINMFVDTRISEFAPYDAREAAVWTSVSPGGAVVHIEMRAAGGWANPDDGSVVVAETATDHWTFSTIWTVMDMAHPVSGNRQFGFSPGDGGGYVFYTRGADRTTGVLDVAAMSLVYSAAHNLWLSFQQAVAGFVNSNGGSASIGTATSIRTPWPAIKAAHHHPSVTWV